MGIFSVWTQGMEYKLTALGVLHYPQTFLQAYIEIPFPTAVFTVVIIADERQGLRLSPSLSFHCAECQSYPDAFQKMLAENSDCLSSLPSYNHNRLIKMNVKDKSYLNIHHKHK